MTNSVAKISRLVNFGVFRDYHWASDLPVFGRYNLIYGWNGSGKTLLSRVFAGLERGSAPDDCEDVQLELTAGDKIGREDFEAAGREVAVRVFNREFLDQSVFPTQGTVEPIYVLGEVNVAKQKDLDALDLDITNTSNALETSRKARTETESELQTLSSEGARVVKEALRSSGPTDRYANYERPDFKKRLDDLPAGSPDHQVLQPREHDGLLETIKAEARPTLESVSFSFHSAEPLFEQAKELVERSIVSSVIQDLRERPDVNAWARDGLELHHRHGTETCLFCNQRLPALRIATLEAHFSEEYTRLLDELEAELQGLNALGVAANGLQLPVEEQFYPDLRGDYSQQRRAFDAEREKNLQAFQSLVTVLKKKREDPFQNYGDQLPSVSFHDQPITRVNEIIEAHNRRVQNHERDVNEAKERIEVSLVAQKAANYRRLNQDLKELDQQIKAAEADITTFAKGRGVLERDLKKHHRPAAELNQDLTNYLGHSELQFEVLDTGYRIVRSGEVAESLSEGERTAIAFLYFLKSLEDTDFDMENATVVIDDPVSSLDANALYNAFAFMKDRTEHAGQLIILTHSFMFFRQVKRWFSRLKKSQRRYYMLEIRRDGNDRTSVLLKLDRLLKNYESEYQYIFWLVYRASREPGDESGLDQYHYLPNVARRLLEAFLEFKFPGEQNLHARLENVAFDPVKKVRIERFCNTHSHNATIEGVEQDTLILAEARSVAEDIMELIQKGDPTHFEQMRRLVVQQSPTEAA